MNLLKNPYEWLIGLRYLRGSARAGNNGISLIAFFSMFGIAIGVWALIVVPSVMNGFQKEVLERMVAVVSHIEVISNSGAIADWQALAAQAGKNPAVRGAAPYTAAPALLLNDGEMRPALVRGVLPGEEPKVSEVASQIVDGKFDDLRPGEFGIVLGDALASALHVGVGQKVTLGTNQGQITVGGVIPRLKPFRVVGIFHAGEYEYDSTLALVHIEDAEKMFRYDGPTGLRLKLADFHDAPFVGQQLAAALGPDYAVRDWSRQNPTWFAAVHTEKTMMTLILGIIIIVSSFTLIITLVMTVTDKRSDIAILRTMGASPAAVMRIFVVEGGLLGLLGTGLGVIVGVVTAKNIDVIVPFIERMLGVRFLPPDVYFISEMPSDMHCSEVGMVAAFAVFLSFLATLGPSWLAARTQPAEALRYE